MPSSPMQVHDIVRVGTDPRVVAVYAQRVARIAAGSALVVGPLAALLARVVAPELAYHTPVAIVGAWLTAALLYVAARAVVPHVVDAAELGDRLGDRLLTASVSLPLFGALLLLPLTLHLPFGLVLSTSDTDYDTWVLMSAGLVGHCHLIIAGMAARRAANLAAGRPALSPWVIYAITVGSSVIPGIFLLAVPIVLVALTGLPLVAVMAWADRVIARERALGQA